MFWKKDKEKIKILEDRVFNLEDRFNLQEAEKRFENYCKSYPDWEFELSNITFGGYLVFCCEYATETAAFEANRYNLIYKGKLIRSGVEMDKFDHIIYAELEAEKRYNKKTKSKKKK